MSSTYKNTRQDNWVTAVVPLEKENSCYIYDYYVDAGDEGTNVNVLYFFCRSIFLIMTLFSCTTYLHGFYFC